MSTHTEMVAILDFGSQYTQLIARRVREAKVYCEILPFNTPAAKLRNVKAVILSGGPASVFWKKSPECDRAIFGLGVPVLGICYGLQLMAKALGGKVTASKHREYGHADLSILDGSGLFTGLPKKLAVWMSHGDRVDRLPKDFKIVAKTNNGVLAAIRHKNKPFYGVQFHPEVEHTPRGRDILGNFLFKIAGCGPSWNMHSFVASSIRDIRAKVGKGKVLLGMSGGVDSSTLAVLLHKALGKQLISVFVNNGLLRKDEAEQVVNIFRKKFKLNLVYVDASKSFLKLLEGVSDPEKKRKIIGHEFIRVFDTEAKKHKGIQFLGQGTLYPDVIESVSALGGPSATIKSHHNVGGLPEKMNLKLLEPFRELFKDEVRAVGRELKLPPEIINRHPFPGPGLAVRVLGPIEKSKLDLLREADHIYIEEMKKAGLYEKVWQAFAVLLPVQTVGVMGDQRTYDYVTALRAVHSTDGMTATWVKFPYEFLEKVSSRIINEVKGINRVAYDISTKPPSTIEWE